VRDATKFVPVLGQLIELGFAIAERVKARRAARRERTKAENRKRDIEALERALSKVPKK